MFPGFTEDTVQFLLDLRFHNEVPWMHAHHEEYVLKVQQPFYQLIAELSPTMLRIDPDFELRPSKALSRINRDTRYTLDKSPYRDHHWVAFRPAGVDKYGQPFYWFEFGPDRLSWGAGIWGQDREAMNAFRLKLLHEGDRVAGLLSRLSRRRFAVDGEQAPRMKVPGELAVGLAPLYRLKSIYVERIGIDARWAYEPALIDRVSRDFLALKPVYALLRECARDAAQEAPASAAVQRRTEDF